MDDLDMQLNIALEKGVSIGPQPFTELAGQFGVDTAEILLRTARLKRSGRLSRVQVSVDFSALGYQNALVAMRFETGTAEAAAVLLGQHPGVSSVVQYDHPIGLWFSLSLPSEDVMKDHVEHLKKLAGAEEALLLPARRRFSEDDSGTLRESGGDRRQFRKPAWGPVKLSVLRALQDDFPISDRPFDKIAGSLGLDISRFWSVIDELRRERIIGRIVGRRLRPESAQASALVVWQVPGERVEDVGRKLALSREAAHVSVRPGYDNFPYTLYSVIRAKDYSQGRHTVRRLEALAGSWPHEVLWKVREFKRTPLKYFAAELDFWRERVKAFEAAGA